MKLYIDASAIMQTFRPRFQLEETKKNYLLPYETSLYINV